MADIHCDGYTLYSNPSKVGGGYVVYVSRSEDQEDYEHTEITKSGLTNNEAELLAALRATELAEDYDVIVTDSMNTYWWITKCKVKARPDLLKFAVEANRNIQKKNLEIVQRPREVNKAGNYIEFVLKK